MLGESVMIKALLILSFLALVQPFSLKKVTYAIVRTCYSSQKIPSSTLRLASSDSLMEDGVTLNSLSDTHADGIFLKESIQRWLDEEYIPQDIHKELGEEVRKIYVEKRNTGVSDLGEMMMTVGTALESVDMGEAFVGAWDVANKVSDFLMVRLDRELCSCAGDLSKYIEKPVDQVAVESSSRQEKKEAVVKVDIFSMKDAATTRTDGAEFAKSNDNEKEKNEGAEEDMKGMGLTTPLRVSPKQKVYRPIAAVVVESKELSQAAKALRTEFSRYKLLRDFLEVVPTKKRLPFAGDVTWQQMHPVVALCLGFRVKDGKIEQDLTVEPSGWDGLEIVPDLSDLREESGLVAKRMFLDLPDDEGATDIVIEQLAGLEMFQKMKASGDREVQRRILIGKWLYTQGFFDDQFPPLKRFRPAHLSSSGADDDEEDDE